MRGDDALGPYVVNLLKDQSAIEADYISVQGDLSRLLDQWENRSVILIDCVQSGSEPGTLFEVSSLDQLLASDEILSTTHGMNLSQTLELGRSLDKIPRALKFYGIEGQSLEMGSEISAAVLSCVPKLQRQIEEELRAP